MAKKFFYNRVYNTKRTIINLVIIGVCIIGVILCFIITSNFQGENHNTPEGSLSIKNKVTVELNEEISKEMFFSKIENVDLDKIEVKYPNSFNSSVLGKYEIILKIDNKDYKTNLVVVDTTKPNLKLKSVTILKGQKYTIDDFIEDCRDNSNKKCDVSFYSNGFDENGKSINYSAFTEVGTHSIKITAKDDSGNQIIKETQLIIKKSAQDNSKPVTVNCKYGNNIYDTSKYIQAIDVSNNGCAISLDLYNDATIINEVKKLMETEAKRIKKDVDKLNLNGQLTLNSHWIGFSNLEGDGLVGYQLYFNVVVGNQNNGKVIVEYKLDKNGKRIFTTNTYNIPI